MAAAPSDLPADVLLQAAKSFPCNALEQQESARNSIVTPSNVVCCTGSGAREMIFRIWRGWTNPANALAYEELLCQHILPWIRDRRRGKGFFGANALQRDDESLTEFVTILRFESWPAVMSFAGKDAEVAVVPPVARRLLARFDVRAKHYEQVLALE